MTEVFAHCAPGLTYRFDNRLGGVTAAVRSIPLPTSPWSGCRVDKPPGASPGESSLRDGMHQHQWGGRADLPPPTLVRRNGEKRMGPTRRSRQTPIRPRFARPLSIRSTTARLHLLGLRRNQVQLKLPWSGNCHFPMLVTRDISRSSSTELEGRHLVATSRRQGGTSSGQHPFHSISFHPRLHSVHHIHSFPSRTIHSISIPFHLFLHSIGLSSSFPIPFHPLPFISFRCLRLRPGPCKSFLLPQEKPCPP